MIPRSHRLFLVPTRRVGMQYRRAAPREAVESNWVLLWFCVTGRSASWTAFPRSAWERGFI